MPSSILLLAHAGAAENPWFGIVVIAAAVTAVVFLLAAAGRIPLESLGDLLLPAAVVVLLAGLGGSVGDAIADRAPIAVPILAVLVIALLVGAATPARLAFAEPLGWGALALSVVGVVALGPVLETTFFPPPETLPMGDDAELEMELVEGPDADGRVTVQVTVTGGTIAASPTDPPPADVEEAMVATFVSGPAIVVPDVGPTDCTPTCTSTTYELTLPPTADGGIPEQVYVELLTARQLPFGPPLRAFVDVPPLP